MATDDDREGEGTAWHICVLFSLPFFSTKRIKYNEITEEGILTAMKYNGRGKYEENKCLENK